MTIHLRLKITVIIVVLLLFSICLPSSTALAAGFTVNSTGDGGDHNPGDLFCDASTLPGRQCTLRAAIEEVNALGGTSLHTIQFNIPGSGSFTIAPSSPLPTVTAPTGFLALSQPGTICPGEDSPAELQIVLDGSYAGAGANGLVFGAGSDGSLVEGLAFGHFSVAGVRIESDDNTVQCSHFGLHADGVSPMGNLHGLYILGDGNRVGKQGSAAQRNVFSGNRLDGIRVLGGSANELWDNFIGTTADGMQALDNSNGAYVAGQGNTIGGSVISGNVYGIVINGGDDNLILGNRTGTARDGISPLPNSAGVFLSNDAMGNVIGGTTHGEANLIAHNDGDGVLMLDSVVGVPEQNTIRGNRIFDNGSLGIDLGPDGVTANDFLDVDGGANGLQNYPLLLPDDSSNVLITGSLHSVAHRQYAVDLYRNDSCDPSGNGEGHDFLTSTVVTTNNFGHAGFEIDVSTLPVAPGDSITATATDAAGNTSEFSPCMTVPEPATPTPTPTHTATATSSPTATHTATPGPSPTATNTATPGPSPTATHTATPGPSPTATHTATPGPSPTATNTPTPGPSPTPTHTATPGPSPTATATGVPGPAPANVVYLPMMITR